MNATAKEGVLEINWLAVIDSRFLPTDCGLRGAETSYTCPTAGLGLSRSATGVAIAGADNTLTNSRAIANTRRLLNTRLAFYGD